MRNLGTILIGLFFLVPSCVRATYCQNTLIRKFLQKMTYELGHPPSPQELENYGISVGGKLKRAGHRITLSYEGRKLMVYVYGYPYEQKGILHIDYRPIPETWQARIKAQGDYVLPQMPLDQFRTLALPWFTQFFLMAGNPVLIQQDQSGFRSGSHYELFIVNEVIGNRVKMTGARSRSKLQADINQVFDQNAFTSKVARFEFLNFYTMGGTGEIVYCHFPGSSSDATIDLFDGYYLITRKLPEVANYGADFDSRRGFYHPLTLEIAHQIKNYDGGKSTPLIMAPTNPTFYALTAMGAISQFFVNRVSELKNQAPPIFFAPDVTRFYFLHERVHSQASASGEEREIDQRIQSWTGKNRLNKHSALILSSILNEFPADTVEWNDIQQQLALHGDLLASQPRTTLAHYGESRMVRIKELMLSRIKEFLPAFEQIRESDPKSWEEIRRCLNLRLNSDSPLNLRKLSPDFADALGLGH